jgi:hypothetical protein
MPYTPPTRATLQAALARDLRDPDLGTFTAAELNDLINQSVVEVSRIYPKQEVQELTVTEDMQRTFATDCVGAFRVELMRDGEVGYAVVHNDHEYSGEGGWDLHAGFLWLPKFASNYLRLDQTPTVRVWGYWPRDLFSVGPEGDIETLDGDAEAEFGVRVYATLLGYQRLQNDRLLFQQWLTTTGNTDVSPNQLSQTADLYQSQWREMRNRLRSLQRV